MRLKRFKREGAIAGRKAQRACPRAFGRPRQPSAPFHCVNDRITDRQFVISVGNAGVCGDAWLVAAPSSGRYGARVPLPREVDSCQARGVPTR